MVGAISPPSWRERLGLSVAPVSPGAIWLHASSVGEVGAAVALAGHLPGPLLVTADTPAGAARARAAGLVAQVLPVDLAPLRAPLLAEARPRAIVFLESSWWPLLARDARASGIPVAQVSARVSPRSARLRRAAQALFFRPDLLLARDAAEAGRLADQHGGPVEIGGDLKADGPAPAACLAWSRPFAVGASLRRGDAARFLAATEALGIAALVAPRYPDRFDPAELGGRPYARRSALGSAVPPDATLVLLDTLGELPAALVGAAWAFVGGTFDPAIGGHSPWDAVRAGVPVVAGPWLAAQGDAFARIGAAVDADLVAAARRARPPRRPEPVAPAVAARILALLGPPAPERPPRPWAAPLVPVAAIGGAARRLRRPLRAEVPVISVGSTNARSPGRTSTVRALVGLLADRRVGVATRGYRRDERGRDVRGSWATRTAAALGDEGALLAEAGAVVAAGPDRRAAVSALAGRVDVILLDDGLQRVDVARDLDLCVIDARFPLARGRLPAGERREAEPVPARADLVLVHHGDGVFGFPGHPVGRRPGPWQGRGAPGGPVAAWCAIGRGADFLASLEVPVARARLDPDHATPDGAELLAFAGGFPLVCTAKDAVRLPPDARARASWRDVELTLPDALLAAVRALVGPVRARPG